MSVIEVNESLFNELVKDNTVFIDFYADWCGPCKMLKPSVERLANEHPEIKVVEVNVDREMNLAMKYGVQSIPALFVVKNGEVVNQALGFMPYNKLEEMLK